MRATRYNDDRRAAAAVEFALFLPCLTILLLGAIDFSRLFYYYITVTNCARNGAIWASDPYANPALSTVTSSTTQSPYSSVTAAALADSNLSPTPTVSSTTPDANSNVSVTVTYTFTPLSRYLGFSSITMARTITMRVLPTTAS